MKPYFVYCLFYFHFVLITTFLQAQTAVKTACVWYNVAYYFDETVIDMTQEVINQDTTVYDWVATMPFFKGGHHALHKYLRENIQINNNYFQTEGCYTVYVIFIVEKDGTVSDLHLKLPKVITKTRTQTDFLVTPMPKWIAGSHNGYTKRVRMVLPMKIKISF